MERLIQDKLEEYTLEQNQGRWRASIEILKLMERHGMRPPATTKLVIVEEWEPENEK